MKAFRQLDNLLRAAHLAQRSAVLRPELGLGPLLFFVLSLGALYGFFMGWYSVSVHWGQSGADGWLQLLASTLKFPALFLCTLLVTFPSLYVFSALGGVHLDFEQALRVMLAAIVVHLTVAASLGTILAFFTLSTRSYPFMVVLNIALLGVAGSIGLAFLRRALQTMSTSVLPVAPVLEAPAAPAASEAQAPPPQSDSSVPPPASRGAPQVAAEAQTARMIFRVWTVLYGLVGVQMAWLLRPMIGRPELTFSWFRAREGNFFLGALQNLADMFGP